MAGLGFRNCIRVQETKLKDDAHMDEETVALYLSILFWYGSYLSDQNELIESKDYLEKALQLSKSTLNDPARSIIILHKLAELSFRLRVKLFTFYLYLFFFQNIVKINH